MADLVPEQVFPRPPFVPDEVSNIEIVNVVRAFLYGEKYEICALSLGVSIQQFNSLIRGAHWRELQNQFRDEFLATTGNRLVRLEQKVLDKIEGYLDEGVEGVYFDKLNGATVYTRQLSPREAAVIARTLAETNKRIDKFREDPSRKSFDFADRLRKLESVANAKTIEGERAA